MRRTGAGIAVLAGALMAIGARAAYPDTPGLYATGSAPIQMGFNSGIEGQASLFLRLPFCSLDGTWLDIGALGTLSEFYYYGGFAALSVSHQQLSVSVQEVGYWSDPGVGFYELPGYGAAFGQSDLKALTAGTGSGLLVTGAVTLVYEPPRKSWAAFLSATLRWFDVGTGGHGYFYEPENNVVLAGSDSELVVDAAVLGSVICAKDDAEPYLQVGLTWMPVWVLGSWYTTQKAGLATNSTFVCGSVTIMVFSSLGVYANDRYLANTPYFQLLATVQWRITPKGTDADHAATH